MKTTPNLKLKKPEQYDDYDVDDFNANADFIDAAYVEIQDDIKDINIKLENGTGDYTVEAIKNASVSTSMLDSDLIPKVNESGTLRTISYSYFKEWLKSYFETVFPPRKHSNESGGFGMGSNTEYGHVRAIGNLNQNIYTVGDALAANQGKVLADRISTKAENTALNSHVSAHTQHVSAQDRADWGGKAEKSLGSTIWIPASAWTGAVAPFSATIAVTGITPSSNFVMSQLPTSASDFKEFATCWLNVHSQGTDTITIRAYNNKPTRSLQVKVIRFG